MTQSEDKKPKLVEWISAGTAVLRATRHRKLRALADRLDAWAVKASRRRVVVFVVALLAFVAVAKPLGSGIADGVMLLVDHWGACYERDPSSADFSGRRVKRLCAPGQVAIFTWREGGDRSACSDCNNRALQLTAVGSDGKQDWTEYYLVRTGGSAVYQWRPAHSWSLAHPRLNIGDYDEGIVLQRVDSGSPVCSTSGKPLTLEFAISLDVGFGCDGALAANGGVVASVKTHFERARGFTCEFSKNSLHYRWVPLGTVEAKGPCVIDPSNPYLTKPDPVAPIKWNRGPLVVVLRRD